MKLTNKQAEYIQKATHRWNFKVGATGAGKSFIDSFYIIPQRILERKTKSGLSVIMGVTRETIERNVLQPMREHYGELVGNINNRNIARILGEDIYCLGAEKINQLSKIQGATFKYMYGDEVARWNEEVFNFAKSRLRTDVSCFDGTLNPESPSHFIKKFIDSDVDIYCQHYTIDDNPFYPEEQKEQLKREYAGTVLYDRYILGLWKQAEGAIYKLLANDPERYRHKGDLPPFMRICVGVDFGGGQSNYAWVATGQTWDNRIVALASESLFLPDKTPQECDALAVNFCERVTSKYGRIDWLYWDCAQTSLGVGLEKALSCMPEINVRPTVKEPIMDRVKATLRLMGADKFSYTEDCIDLVKAFEEAVYNSKNIEDERLDDGTSDINLLDAFEYSWQRWIRNYDKR